MILINPIEPGFFPFEYPNEEIHKLSMSDGPVFVMILIGFLFFPFIYRLGYKLRYQRKKFEWILFGVGVFLFLFEIFKQVTYAKMYHYFPGQENEGHYLWRILPLQLCSLHIYMCLLVPFLKKKAKQDVSLFIGFYAFIGGISVLIGGLDMVLGGFQLQDGRWFGDWGLVVHTLLWHIILLNLGAFVFGYYRLGDLRFYHIKTIVLKPWLICFVFLLIAQGLNVLLPTLMPNNPWLDEFNLWNVSWMGEKGFNFPVLGIFLNTNPVWIGGLIGTFIYGALLLLAAYFVLFSIILIRNISSNMNRVTVYTRDITI